ncbi:MMPL family transporter [Streptomyces longwoodensis]|uniref:MMPL family transporter n=1 Tax=Streptomyces longwoodensis TaxID=68231 RepID=UPI002E807B1C|nr:MMPL family transporter [Streptomyces longwoodensis]WUC61316.1 MMPL family transporter [Streptomyces longwoodensis]WUC74860.1 MMPL family transporter [Streptomyces longwoodensis]
MTVGKTPTKGVGRRRAVPWALLGLWVAVLALAGPFAAKLADVQHDRATDYLPSSADSTRVARIQDALPGGESTEMVIVYHRDGGLNADDRRVAAGQVEKIAAAHQLVGGAPEGIPSDDGTTLMYPVVSNEPGHDEKLRDALVEDVRGIARGQDGLSVEVGGTAALGTDAGKVYDSLGGPLLYTTVAVVALLLILIYRSPVLWLVPLVVAGIADLLSMGVAYGLNQAFGTTVTGQSSAVMTILVFGAGTDYALLLVSRYREELRRIERPYEAMVAALRGCGPAVLASSGTVAAGLLCLLAADLNSSRGMGPLGTVGVLCALIAMLTLLPAVLVLLGRRVFWPLVPAYGSEPAQRRSLFAAMGDSAGRRPLTVLATGAVLLGALALGTLNLPGPVKQEDSFVTEPEAVTAMGILARAYPERGTQPIDVITPADRVDGTLATIRDTRGVESAEKGRTGHGWAEISVIAKDTPQSAGETATIKSLRSRLKGSYVGGDSAEQIDLEDTNSRDTKIVVPLVLVSVLLILFVLLRSLVAPLVLVAAVVAVWGAALGIGGLAFGPVLGLEGTDPGLGLLSFVFLVALGVDYGIFLMHRMREESLVGAEPAAAALIALRSTGAVIASAGLVLAATFAVLMNMGLVQLVELGFVIAVGVLLDTFLVRTYLVTSASVALRRKMWWPGALSREPAPGAGPSEPTGPPRQPEQVGAP